VPIPYKTQSRDRILADTEICAIWHSCPQLGNFGTICQLLILTGQRRGQIAALRGDWIKDDAIIFPAFVMKSGQEHILPLAPFTAALLAPYRTTDALLFPSDAGTVHSAWSKPKRKLDELANVADHRIHDYRRYFRTKCAEWKCCDHDTAERLIAHNVGTHVSRIYDRYDRLPEKREAMERYTTHLQRIIGHPTS
jgi:integrase